MIVIFVILGVIIVFITGFSFGYIVSFSIVFRNAYEVKPLTRNASEFYKVVQVNDNLSWDALGTCMKNEEDE